MDSITPQPIDAIELLTQDHRNVDALFKEFESTSGSARKRDLANRICDELTLHATVEEEIFYPAAIAMLPEDDSDLIWEATVEHGTLEGLIEVIRAQDGSEEDFDAHVKVLKEYVQHHVKEEEGEMFPKVRKSELDVEAVGAALAERKQALMAEAPARGRRSTRNAGAKTAAKTARGGTRRSAPQKSGARTRKSR